MLWAVHSPSKTDILELYLVSPWKHQCGTHSLPDFTLLLVITMVCTQSPQQGKEWCRSGSVQGGFSLLFLLFHSFPLLQSGLILSAVYLLHHGLPCSPWFLGEAPALTWFYSQLAVPSGHTCSAVAPPQATASSITMEHLLFLSPGCSPCCSSPFLFSPTCLWHFLPFLKYIFTEVWQTPPMGSALVRDGAVSVLLDPPVSSTGKSLTFPSQGPCLQPLPPPLYQNFTTYTQYISL